MNTIPAVDISPLMGDADTELRKQAAKQLATATKMHGCAAISGHGLSEGTLQEAFAMMQRLFDLPIEEKMKAPHPEALIPHRGYLAKEIENSGKLGVLHSKSDSEKEFLKTAKDWKETYDIGHEENEDQKNNWLPEATFPGFRPYMIKLYERLSTISSAVLEGLMMGMELSEKDCNTLRQIHSPIEHQMRLAHYLPFSLENQRDPQKIRLAPHKDFASYTLLFQQSKSGLEFQNRETGEYMPAVPREGVLYFNIGDLFERFSNGFYPSAMHRVVIPTTKDADGTIPGHLSIPFFALVNMHGSIYPMPSRVEADGKANFEHTTYQDLVSKLFGLLS